jgi:hypothetical protein
MLDTIVPVSPGTNVCPEKSGAAQNRLTDQPWRIMSIALREWAHGF